MAKKEKDFTYVRKNVVVTVTRDEAEICNIIDMKINGVSAFIYDFGISKDIDKAHAPACGCGNRVFIPDEKKLTPEVLARYHLTTKDRRDLLWILSHHFNIGFCKRCK